MIANFEYGNYDINLSSKYKITNYKDCVLSSGSNLVDEEKNDDLEDELVMNPKRELKVKYGTKVGIFFCDDYDYNDDIDGSYKLHGEVNFINDSVIYNDATQNDYTGEVSKWVIMLGDNRFITGAGEYCIITKENSEDELNKFNQAIGKHFDIIILSTS